MYTDDQCARQIKTCHREIRGVDYHYETSGHGRPVLLLHGGMTTLEMMAPLKSVLEDAHLVISVDLQGHGATPLGSRPWHIEDVADDLISLIESEAGGKADVVGYSLGAGVALRMAIQRRKSIDRLMLISGFFSSAGPYPEIRAQQKQISGAMAENMRNGPLGEAYLRRAPKDELNELMDALGKELQREYDWSDELKSLDVNALLVFGDRDMYPIEYVMRFYQLMNRGREGYAESNSCLAIHHNHHNW